MATAIIYVFSGTGNTLTVARMIQRSFKKRGVSTTLYALKEPHDPPPSPADYDYVGFGYPIHAFNCPQIFLRFVNSLPDIQNKSTFIFKTSGEPFRFNDASSYRLYRTLINKGFKVFKDMHLLMPYNIMFRYKDSLVKQMLQYNKALCHHLVAQLLDDQQDRLRYHLHHRIISILFRIQQPGAVLNGRFYSVNMKKCTMCMRCVTNCPTNNITLSDGKLKFDGHCAMCMRCVMDCPTDAINPGILRLWKVNGAYNFERILSDPNIPANCINENTKGYFRLFRKYYLHVDTTLSMYEKDQQA